MNNRVTVIIVNWNGKNLLSKCLNGLRRQTYKRFSTVLVDNGSTDGSTKYVESNFPEVKIIALAENTGFCVANNIAIKKIKTEFVALLNNDAIDDENWLQNLINALDHYPEAGFAASKMLYFNQPEKIDRAGDAYTTAGAGQLRGRGQPNYKYNRKEWVFGACAGAALYRLGMLKDIGLFDEDFFLLYEDVDLSFRAQLKGYRCLYVPNATVFHMTTSSIGYDSDISIYYGHRNLEWTYIHNMPRSLILRTIIPHMIYFLFSLCFFVFIGKGKIFLKAKKDALRGISRSIKKRKIIQGRRKVSNNYIFQLLTFENIIFRYYNHKQVGK